MDLTSNVNFLSKIDTTVKSIMKDGKIDQYDIPEILLLITDLIVTSEEKKVTQEQLEKSINCLYQYIMTHYNLFPEDETQRDSFKKLFEVSVKLIMVQPKVKKGCKYIFPCLA
jgi:hypothetical protein